MSRETDNLTHHEELRLDYLHKNYHYLNDREKKELAYLEYKAEELSRQVRYPSQMKGRSRRQSSRLESDYLDDVRDLPRYPREERKRRKRRETVKPIKKRRKKGRLKRILLAFLGLFLMALSGMVFMFFKGMHSVDTTDAQAAETEYFDGQDTADGVNILILGTDGRNGQTSAETRTDSIMVLNVNNSDKKVKLVSFMRDTIVHIPGYSADYGEEISYDHKLNLAYTLGEQNDNQGAELTRQVLKDNFDIDIKYYAMIDFSTFATAIDTIFPEGVEIDAQFATVEGVEVTSIEVPNTANADITRTITEGMQRMDGETLLDYARFRKDDEGDYGRAKRQQQVIAAILSQVKNPTKLFTGSEAIGKVFAMTSTNVPYSFVLTDGFSVVTSGQDGIEKITVPEYGDWVEEYDIYGGLGLSIDFDTYKQKLSELGLR